MLFSKKRKTYQFRDAFANSSAMLPGYRFLYETGKYDELMELTKNESLLKNKSSMAESFPGNTFILASLGYKDAKNSLKRYQPSTGWFCAPDHYPFIMEVWHHMRHPLLEHYIGSLARQAQRFRVQEICLSAFAQQTSGQTSQHPALSQIIADYRESEVDQKEIDRALSQTIAELSHMARSTGQHHKEIMAIMNTYRVITGKSLDKFYNEAVIDAEAKEAIANYKPRKIPTLTPTNPDWKQGL